MFYFMMHLTHFMYGYIATNIGWPKDHSDNERKPAAATSWATVKIAFTALFFMYFLGWVCH